jgi:hypothetical protein
VRPPTFSSLTFIVKHPLFTDRLFLDFTMATTIEGANELLQRRAVGATASKNNPNKRNCEEFTGKNSL